MPVVQYGRSVFLCWLLWGAVTHGAGNNNLLIVVCCMSTLEFTQCPTDNFYVVSSIFAN